MPVPPDQQHRSTFLLLLSYLPCLTSLPRSSSRTFLQPLFPPPNPPPPPPTPAHSSTQPLHRSFVYLAGSDNSCRTLCFSTARCRAKMASRYCPKIQKKLLWTANISCPYNSWSCLLRCKVPLRGRALLQLLFFVDHLHLANVQQCPHKMKVSCMIEKR